jgi:hypothetical protein
MDQVNIDLSVNISSKLTSKQFPVSCCLFSVNGFLLPQKLISDLPSSLNKHLSHDPF